MIDTTRIACGPMGEDYLKVTSDSPHYVYIKTCIDYEVDEAAELDRDGVKELIDILIEWQEKSAAAEEKWRRRCE